MLPLKIMHFSDIPCVWAYVGQSSFERLVDRFGNRIDVQASFCSVFPDARGKIVQLWRDRGGFDGYADHVRQVVVGFADAKLHDDVWSKVRPASSASPHLFVKALELAAPDPVGTAFRDKLSTRAARELRLAFFRDAEDIADWEVQRRVIERVGVDFPEVRARIETGEAIAGLAADYDRAQSMHVRGSSTYILNEGRQTLFGNVSHGVLEANIAELLREGRGSNASEC